MNNRMEYDMNCEEFELVGLDSRRDDSLQDESRRRAAQHARVCGKCASLTASWEGAQEELSPLREFTRLAQPPARVENRLLQQFRLRHQPGMERRKIRFASWALAAAAVVVCMLSVWSWENWRHGQRILPGSAQTAPTAPTAPTATATATAEDDGAALALASDASAESANFLLASNDGEFTQLPGAWSQEVDGSSIVRVGMPRSSLAALGLPVNEERADEWIQVDVLVASDGSPQAVRLPE